MTRDLPLSLHCSWSYVWPNFANSKKKKKNKEERTLDIESWLSKKKNAISFSKLIQHFRSYIKHFKPWFSWIPGTSKLL